MFQFSNDNDRMLTVSAAFVTASDLAALRILFVIAEKEKTARDIISLVSFPKMLVYSRLGMLSAAGLIEMAYEMKETTYQITPSGREIVMAASNIASSFEETGDNANVPD